ncbi:MAG TPA: TonB-dependent receptor, partial [Chitinophagaceae bacterium]|nr:TonB-dependent receptor [Chitinophagaceae bacterium]
MIMRKYFTLCTLLLVLALQLTAQDKNGKISGVVVDASNNPLVSATISLLKADNASLLKTTLSGKDGKYEFAGIADGQYLVQVTSTGLEKKTSKVITINASQNSFLADAIVMQPVSKNLGEVTVTSKKPFIETKIDKTIVNVEASPTSAGATALEILEKSPGVTVDNDGNISLKGKQGVIIMMDGKPTYLSPADLSNLLKNTPASALEQIEIMTNPSARFDATGNSGVINIKTKKGKNPGFNGSVMVGITSSIYKPDDKVYFIPKSQNSINFNWRKNKINFFGNYNPNYFRGRNTMNLESKFLDENMNITGYNITE